MDLQGLTRTKRKRKLIVDDVKAISWEEIKGQLSDTGDIVTNLVRTVHNMHIMESVTFKRLELVSLVLVSSPLSAYHRDPLVDLSDQYAAGS